MTTPQPTVKAARRGFGAGCVSFGLRRETPYEFKTEEFVQILKERLQRIPTLNNLEVDFHDFDDETITDAHLLKTANGKAYFPNIELSLR